jgi:hypothetical protein
MGGMEMQAVGRAREQMRRKFKAVRRASDKVIRSTEASARTLPFGPSQSDGMPQEKRILRRPSHMPMKHRLHFHDGQHDRGAALARLGEIEHRVCSVLAQITLRDLGAVEITISAPGHPKSDVRCRRPLQAAWSGLFLENGLRMDCSGRLENGDNLTPVSDHDRLPRRSPEHTAPCGYAIREW